MSSVVALPQRRVWECMGTVFSVDVRGGGVAPVVLAEQIDWTHRMDRLFSPYEPESEISRLRDGRLDIEHASSTVRDILQRCRELTLETDGYFDVHAGGELDPNGYVKGWAIQSVSDALVAAGSTDHCVNCGGDVQCVGSAGADEPWRVGIAHPLEPATFVDVVSGSGELAVATSGTAERGRHIIDPRRRTRPDRWASVTVVGRQIHVVDALATACLAMADDAAGWLRRHGLTAVLVGRDAAVQRIVA